MQQRLIFFIFIIFTILTGCNKRTTNGVTITLPDSSRIQLAKFGSENTLEIVSWNIENFPKAGNQTVRDVVEIIRDLDIDIITMQEIGDTSSFRILLDSLDNYNGTYSTDTYGNWYQKTAIVYKKDLVHISNKEMLFTNDSYFFPRPPLKVYVTAQIDNKTFDFTLIVLHLKASGGSENEARRRSAIQKLKNYLDTEISSATDKDFIVTGDWNDVLTDPPGSNVFTPFLQDSMDYQFLTAQIAQDPVNNATYIKPPYISVIDQILISVDVLPEYDTGFTQVIKIDNSFSAYINEVSDHRPVAAVFPVF